MAVKKGKAKPRKEERPRIYAIAECPYCKNEILLNLGFTEEIDKDV